MLRMRLLSILSTAALAGAAMTLAGTAASAVPAHAAGLNINMITVNTTSDDATIGDGLCSLRKAINAVDDPGAIDPDCTSAAFGANEIVIPAGEYTLSQGQLQIAPTVTALTITGAGESSAIIDAGGLSRILDVSSGASVSISDLTVSRRRSRFRRPARRSERRRDSQRRIAEPVRCSRHRQHGRGRATGRGRRLRRRDRQHRNADPRRRHDLERRGGRTLCRAAVPAGARGWDRERRRNRHRDRQQHLG